MEAGIAALIVQLEVPFLVLLETFLLGETPSQRKWVGIGISFCGVAVMTQQDELSGSLEAIILVIAG